VEGGKRAGEMMLRFRSTKALVSSLLVIIFTGACGQPTIPLVSTQTPIISTPSLGSPHSTADLTPTSLSIATDTLIPPREIELKGMLHSVTYVIPLTIQHVTSSSATLYFELSQPHAGVLAYMRIDQSLISTGWVELQGQRTKHLITIDDLAAGHEYEAFVGLLDEEDNYKAPGNSDELWDTVHFETPIQDEGVLRLGVLGDSGFGDGSTVLLLEEMASYDLDFVIHTGDLVYNVGEETSPVEAFIEKFYTPFSLILRNMPVYPVVGNHDIDLETIRQEVPFYFHAFPLFSGETLTTGGSTDRREWYAFTIGKIQFLMLNSYTFYSGSGREEQTEWLRGRLADPRFEVSIPVFHIAPFTSGKHEEDGLPIRFEWLPLFKQANVPLVLSGHDHNYERLEHEGITYIVTGGGSAVLYPAQHSLPTSRVFAARTHFVLLEITPDQIELTAIALGGTVLDTALITYK
jgi:predicted phosphodiesterase